jgi:hypothetical protein
MRYALVLAAAALLAPPAVRAADPPITFQTQPFDRLLNDVRMAADLVGGEKAVKSFNEGLKERMGAKGFEGLDLNKPIVGYVVLAPKADDIVGVIAFPITNEKDFLALCDRWNRGVKAKDLGKGLYEVPPLDPGLKARMRFANGYAYVAGGKNPEPALDPKALVAPEKLLDPAETAAFAGKLHFDRITPEVKAALVGLMTEGKKQLLEAMKANAEAEQFKPVFAELEKLATRYLLLLGGADTAALRVSLDPGTGEVVAEATLAPKPNTELARQIAARKPPENRFAGLITPDTVAGFHYSAPLFAEEVRSAYAKLTEAQQKELNQNVPAAAKPTLEELFKGQARAMKAGEGDMAVALRGPDKDGYFSAVAAMSCDNDGALEKAFKKYMQDDNPLGGFGEFKWDAGKEGQVAIHTYKVAPGLIPPTFTLFGENLTLAFAFAPKGIYLSVGPDPVAAVKEALKAKPAVAPAFDLLVNPARVSKVVEKVGGNPRDFEKVLGREDKLLSAMSLRVKSGKELSVRLAIGLKVLPRVFTGLAGSAAEAPVPAPPVVGK